MNQPSPRSLGGPTPAYLGSVGGVVCSVANTSEPWLLDIDVMVISVGSELGGLGSQIRDRIPEANWNAIRFAEVTPEKPQILALPRLTDSRRTLRTAVLATPHSRTGQYKGEPTLSAIRTATMNALVTAARIGHATSIGLPLLGTGQLGLPADEVAAVVIPAVIEVLANLSNSSLQEVLFVCQSEAIASDIWEAWLSTPEGELSPERPAAELAGGVSSDLVDPNTGIPLTDDHLGVAPYVSMLATVIADKKTPLPLSIGIFGEWGSGKSYFMALLRGQIETLTSSGNPAYCGNIDQIGFNAWHYADSNLWASLGDEIFRQLAGPEVSTEHRRDQLRTELAERLGQHKQLVAATRQAQKQAAELQSDVDKAAANRELRTRDLIKALKGSGVLSARLDDLWKKLGITDEVERGRLLAEQMHGTLDEAEALRRAPADRVGKIAVATAATVLIAAVFAAVLAPGAKEWLAGVGGLFTLVAGAGLIVMNRAKSGLQSLRTLAEDLRAGMDRAIGERFTTDVADDLEALRQAEAEQRVAEAQLREVVSQVGELGRQLAELMPGQRLYAFLADRAQSDSYTGNLGLISTIRKDFQQLVDLMADRRKHPDDGPHKPVDRIVLYIDDLDRCSPQQVVDVLQAVHLLLALDLFVVVVGVDPRWLLRSLCSHYDRLLDGEADSEAAGWQVTPEDYLEKILNIPLTLPGMSSGSLSRLLRSIVDDDQRPNRSSADEQPIAAGPQSSDLPNDETVSVERGSEVDVQQQSSLPSKPPRPLTDPEIDLLTALDQLIDTPREAKRTINLYRMLRATRDLSESSRFLGDDGKPGDFQAVIVLLGLLTAHARLLGKALDTKPAPDKDITGGLVNRPATTPWPDFVADFEPRPTGQGWANPIVGTLSETEVRQWARLHLGLTHVSKDLTLEDLSCFQTWVPRIRRFSYALAP